jgi:lipopolysaccharide/colanic/teichoic acid biosynthesis glycosyltransferase
MILRKWEDLPANMRNECVRPYYDSLQKKKINLVCKFIFDRVMSLFMLICLSPVLLILAVLIKQDSPGDVFFRQERVTRYGKTFQIYKFRTMVANAEALGEQVTSNNDVRVTRMGSKLRHCRLDELPQLINILKGEMSFVGTRPEVTKYVQCYTPEMLATLLLPAGVTSAASIEFKDEDKLLAGASDINEAYVNRALPRKMKFNLQYMNEFNIKKDLTLMLKTIGAVI